MLLTEKRHPGSFIVSEEGNNHCRDEIKIAENQDFEPGTVLGRSALPANVTSSSAPDAGNTGNGVLTLDAVAPVKATAKDGKYRVVCIEPAANAGTFAIFDPAGVQIGFVAAGGAFDGEIKFALADGATDFIVGDAFTITVGIEVGDYEYKALNLAGVDGEDEAAAIAVYGAKTGAGESAKIAGMVRGPAQVRLSDLTFPAGITAVQKAVVLNELHALGIVAR